METDAQTGFEAYLDAAAMCRLLKEKLPELGLAGQRIAGCSISNAHYKRYLKPSSMHKSWLAACYHLQLDGTAAREATEIILYIKVYRDNRSEQALEAAVAANRGAARTAPVTRFADLDMLVWRFPDDPALPQLPDLTLTERVKPRLPYAQLPPIFSTPADPPEICIDIVNYRPELRCTCRYLLERGTARDLLFGKTYREPAADIAARIECLYELSRANPQALSIAHPLLYDAVTHTIWQQGIDGTSLCGQIDAASGERFMRAVARGIAVIHRSAIPCGTSLSIDAHLQEFAKKVKKLAQAFPDRLHLLLDLQERLAQAASSSQPATTVIHGDFHIDQLLVAGQTLFLFDFDEFTAGDPMQDLANFIVDLHFHDYDPALVRTMARALLDEYARHADGNICGTRIGLHAAIQFTNKIYRTHIQCRPGANEQFAQLGRRVQEAFESWL